MAYHLLKGNVERIVIASEDRDRLVSDGFILLEVQEKEEVIPEYIEPEWGEPEQSGLGGLNLEALEVDELKNYALLNGINLGRASTKESILKKIAESY